MNHAVKQQLKELLPVSLIEVYRKFANSYLPLRRATLHQMKRYYKAYSKPSSRGMTQVEARLMYYTHQLEKGLSHQNFRYGFGHKPLQYLSKTIEIFRNFPGAHDAVSYKSALSALNEYIQRHEGREEDLNYIKNLFSSEVLEEASSAVPLDGGSLRLRSVEDQGQQHLGNLLESRHSIREYSQVPITYDELRPVLQVAMRTPSVCNRQSTRVRVILEPKLIEQALTIQGGFNGYPMPPALLLLTADNRVFMAPQERNEGFTDGGLFGMSLLLSLQKANIAACPLNTMMKEGPEQATRHLLEIPPHEELVMYIAIGHFQEELLTCRSCRYPVDSIVTVFGSEEDE